MCQEAKIVLDRVVLVKVEANIYGARKKLKKEDLVLADGSKLPPEDLASLGSKKLLDPDKLAVFNRLKKEAERICLRVGSRFLGGFAIPKESAGAITADLERIGVAFQSAKQEFLGGYDAAVNDWVARHPEFAEIIEKAVDTVEFVSTRLSFDFLVLKLGLPEALPAEEAARVERKVGTLSDQMFYEISAEANLFIDKSLLGKEQVTRSALRPIRRMRDKLDGLGFLDHRVAPVVDTIDELLARIPARGAIEGSLLNEILATAMLLADPDKTRRHGEGLLQVQEVPADATVDLSVPEPGEIQEEAVALQVDSTLEEIAGAEEEGAQPPTFDRFSHLFDGILDEEDGPEIEAVAGPDGSVDGPVTQEDETEIEEEAAEATAQADRGFWF